MHITVLAHGSRGDVQPYVALARGLQNAGHSVRLAANTNFATLASDHGLEFFPLKLDSFAFAQEESTRKWLDSNNILELAINSNRVVRPTLGALLESAWEACQGTEAIIYHSFTLPSAFYIGELLGVPCMPANIYPEPTRAYPPLPWNTQRKLPGSFNLMSHLLTEFFVWQVYRPSAKVFFGKDLKISLSGPNRRLRKERRPMICAYSEIILPRPADLPDHIHVTGFWTLDSTVDWQADPKLLDFLQSGESPVYVGFGSMGDPARVAETTEIVVQALTQAGVRGILNPGWSGLGHDIALPETVTVIEPLPHSWLLPQMSVVVHHGGAGTTNAGLRAGVPNVVIPHFSDSYFWAKRVSDLGAGPEPIPRKKLTAERLAEAITAAINNKRLRQRAADIGRQLQAEDGVASAIDVFHQYVS
jgi:UDP:flavonoid glycosyltransferase YjiC (YdhE family)